LWHFFPIIISTAFEAPNELLERKQGAVGKQWIAWAKRNRKFLDSNGKIVRIVVRALDPLALNRYT